MNILAPDKIKIIKEMLYKYQLVISTIKTKKIHRVLELNQSQWLKPYVKFNTQKRIDAEKNRDKDGKELLKLINNAVYSKTMKTLRNRINVKLGKNEKNYLKWTSKPSYMSRNIFDNDLVVIHKSKVILTLNKPT